MNRIQLLVLSLLVAGKLVADEREAILSPTTCSDPPKAMSRTSSGEGFVGIGGPRGKACPDAELFWIAGDQYSAMCFKAKGGKPQSLGAGLAMLSPDCARFWTSTSDGVGVHDARTGKRVHRVAGEDPVWADDSATIYFSAGKRELRRLDVKSGATKTILTVKDYRTCQAPGEGVVFLPPELRDGKILWTYPTKEKGKRLTVDAKTGKVEKTEPAALECEN